MVKILVVGKNSFIANFFKIASRSNGFIVDTCSHKNLPKSLTSYNWVVNFSLNPKMFSEKYSKSIDQDYIISKSLKDKSKTKFVMISSRAVYPCSNSTLPLSELDPLEIKNQKQYGINKIQSESSVSSNLNSNNFLILRASNIFGLEKDRHTFMGIAQKNLVENNEILLDIHEETIKDFIPVSYFCEYLIRLIQNNANGIYNVGSGESITVKEICYEMIEGYGSGLLKIHPDSEIKDQFILNVSKLKKTTGLVITKIKILEYAHMVGKLLKERA
jgi:nucleoside-diphosphate-sugar epimerase